MTNEQKPPYTEGLPQPVSGQVLTVLLRHAGEVFSRWCPVSIMDVKGWHVMPLQAFDGLSRGLRLGMGYVVAGFADDSIYEYREALAARYQWRLDKYEADGLDFLFESDAAPTQYQHQPTGRMLDELKQAAASGQLQKSITEEY